MYQFFAPFYDGLYQSKDYEKESSFVKEILCRNRAHTLLDVGCGTGTHLAKLERAGFQCYGLDLNEEMIRMARTKCKGSFQVADMRSFELGQKFDAIISMFAVFNHNLDANDAKQTLLQIKKHLNEDGVLILDLYNCKNNGKKENTFGSVKRVMQWEVEGDTCQTQVTFLQGDQIHIESFNLRFYTVEHLNQMLLETGFKNIRFYDNYSFKEGSNLSKNLIVVANQ